MKYLVDNNIVLVMLYYPTCQDYKEFELDKRNGQWTYAQQGISFG
jgi:hypothetical protein